MVGCCEEVHGIESLSEALKGGVMLRKEECLMYFNHQGEESAAIHTLLTTRPPIL